MKTILYLAHTESGGILPKLALETLQAAVELSKKLDGSKLVVGLIGEEVKKGASQVASCGAQEFLGVGGTDFSVSRYATDALAAEALVRKVNAEIVLAPLTSRFARPLPGVAGRLDGRVDTHVSGFEVTEGTLKIKRWYYRQRMVATLTRVQRPWFLLLDSGVFQPWSGPTGEVSFEEVSVTLSEDAKQTEVKGIQAPAVDTQTIRPDAELLFVAGAGWTKKQADGQVHTKEAGALILGFLNQTKASLGSSKSLVDQSSEGQAVLSFMSHLNQIGQTGSTPRHPKGLATCCHGEEPHVVGWRFINERRAVNTDPNCGWAQGKADILYVADAFQVVAKVNEQLQKKS